MRKINSKTPPLLSEVVLEPSEYCYYVYLPIQVDGVYSLPERLDWVNPLIEQLPWNPKRYMYLTVKHMIVEGYGNRKGWHIDGYGSDDVNFIWSDTHPTEVCVQEFNIPDSHEESLKVMEESSEDSNIVRLQPNGVYELNLEAVHRTPLIDKPVLRTFIKVTYSDDLYQLKGNAVNPAFDYLPAPSVVRSPSRNHPQRGGIIYDQ